MTNYLKARGSSPDVPDLEKSRMCEKRMGSGFEGPVYDDKKAQQRTSDFYTKLALDLLFVLGSLLYAVLAFEPIEYYQWSESLSLSQEVIDTTDDDAFWWTWYYTNGRVPEELYFADDETLYAWYEDSFPDEGYVFEVGGTVVTRYMILYFCAAMCFLIVGVLSFWVYRHWFAIVMTLAGAFGVASSMLVMEDEWVSLILESVSIHLFALEAVYLLLFFRRQERAANPNATASNVLFVGDLFFVVGTLMDLVLSYVSLVGVYRLPHAYTAIAAATCWLICSLLYLFATLAKCRLEHDEINAHIDSSDIEEQAAPSAPLSPSEGIDEAVVSTDDSSDSDLSLKEW